MKKIITRYKYETTVAEYLISIIKNMGIKHIFGIPGDYNLKFLDYIINDKSISFVGGTNELNAAYTADGYARVNNFSALVTTYGVGELSALNGISGGYSENSPIMHIIGAPNELIFEEHSKRFHHTNNTEGMENIYVKISKNISRYVTFLNIRKIQHQIEEAVLQLYIHRKPVTIYLPTNIIDKKISIYSLEKDRISIDIRRNINRQYFLNDKIIHKLVENITKSIRGATNPLFIIDKEVYTNKYLYLIEEILKLTNIPYVDTIMSNGIIKKNYENYLGTYSGMLTNEYYKKIIEKSDCAIWVGWINSDINTGGFTFKFNKKMPLFKIKWNKYSYVGNNVHANHGSVDIKKLLKDLKIMLCDKYKYIYEKDLNLPAVVKTIKSTDRILTNVWLYEYLAINIPSKSIVSVETGTPLFGFINKFFNDDVFIINQALYASIGFALGAGFGASFDSEKRQSIIIQGDGSFQLTCQTISTILKSKRNVIILLINNNGYTIERAIHGMNAEYNDILEWDYCKHAESYISNYKEKSHVKTYKVKTEIEFHEAFVDSLKSKAYVKFIELHLAYNDMPEELKVFAKTMSKRNAH